MHLQARERQGVANEGFPYLVEGVAGHVAEAWLGLRPTVAVKAFRKQAISTTSCHGSEVKRTGVAGVFMWMSSSFPPEYMKVFEHLSFAHGIHTPVRRGGLQFLFLIERVLELEAVLQKGRPGNRSGPALSSLLGSHVVRRGMTAALFLSENLEAGYLRTALPVPKLSLVAVHPSSECFAGVVVLYLLLRSLFLQLPPREWLLQGPGRVLPDLREVVLL